MRNTFSNTQLLLPRSKLALSGLVLIISACASSSPAPELDEVVEQALPETTEIASGFGEVPSWADVVAQGAAKDGWLATFGDDELEKIVVEALQNNRELAVARANLDVASALATHAGA